MNINEVLIGRFPIYLFSNCISCAKGLCDMNFFHVFCIGISWFIRKKSKTIFRLLLSAGEILSNCVSFSFIYDLNYDFWHISNRDFLETFHAAGANLLFSRDIILAVVIRSYVFAVVCKDTDYCRRTIKS